MSQTIWVIPIIVNLPMIGDAEDPEPDFDNATHEYREYPTLEAARAAAPALAEEDPLGEVEIQKWVAITEQQAREDDDATVWRHKGHWWMEVERERERVVA